MEAIEYLQTYKETENIPVVAISADAMEVDIKKAKRAGFNKYLTKPIDVDQFLNISRGFTIGNAAIPISAISVQ